MSDAALSLGPIVFRDFEVPSSISFGGRQRAVVRYLGTGRRVTEAMGPDDATISFAGALSGPSATARAQELDTLRALGLPLTLAWDTLIYSVLITRFHAEYRNRLWIPYRISCHVISNPLFDHLETALSIADDTLASLNLMYETAPTYAPSIPDIRTAVSSAPANFGATATGPAIATLDSIAPSLRAKQQRCEASIYGQAIGKSGALPSMLANFSLTVGNLGTLQHLSLSQACLGQTRLYLTQQAYR